MGGSWLLLPWESPELLPWPRLICWRICSTNSGCWFCICSASCRPLNDWKKKTCKRQDLKEVWDLYLDSTSQSVTERYLAAHKPDCWTKKSVKTLKTNTIWEWGHVHIRRSENIPLLSLSTPTPLFSYYWPWSPQSFYTSIKDKQWHLLSSWAISESCKSTGTTDTIFIFWRIY